MRTTTNRSYSRALRIPLKSHCFDGLHRSTLIYTISVNYNMTSMRRAGEASLAWCMSREALVKELQLRVRIHVASCAKRISNRRRRLRDEKRSRTCGTNRICCWCRVLSVFCKLVSCILSVFCKLKVCPWYKNQKNSNQNGNRASVRYVPKLSVPWNQFRVVPVLLRVFSGHKTMMYTWEVGSTIFSTNLRRHRGLDFHFNFCSRVDIYTPSCTVKDGDYRVVEIKILKSGRKYQPKAASI